MTPYKAYTEELMDYKIGTLMNDELGFSGRSNDWLSTKLEWVHYLAYPKLDYTIPQDTVLLRFNFISDDHNTDKEGWMIDDINIYSIIVGGGGSVEEYNRDIIIKVYPNPASEHISIELDQEYQGVYIETLDLQGKRLGSNQYYNVKHIQLPYYNRLEGYYFLKITLNGEISITKKVILN